jgi:hypothetical protein
MILLLLMLGGCATLERLTLPDAQKPEKNVLSEVVSGVTITELDLAKQFPNLSDLNKTLLSAFFEEGNLLYFAYSEFSNSEHTGVPIATGIYTYNFDTKVIRTILTFDPKKEFVVSSIAVLKGKVYFSGGYPFEEKAGECNYEISVLNGTQAKVLLSETAYSYGDIPRLFKFDASSLAFLQIHHKQLSDTDMNGSFKITQIRSDSTLKSSTEYKWINTKNSTGASPMMDTISIDGKKFAYAVYKNGVASIYSATYDPQTGFFNDALPVKIGEEVSPQYMLGFGNHWYVSSVRNNNMQLHLDVFDQTTGKKVATQIFDGPTSAFGLASFDSESGLFFGNFENDGTHTKPLGIGRLFLGHVEGNTVKYQRIDPMTFDTWPISFAKLTDKKYLIRGSLDPSEPDYRYLILEFK